MKNWWKILMGIIIFAGAFSFYIYKYVINKEYSVEDVLQILKCDINSSHIIDNQIISDKESTTIELEIEVDSEIFNQSSYSKKKWNNISSISEPLVDFQELIQKYHLDAKSATVTTYFVNFKSHGATTSLQVFLIMSKKENGVIDIILWSLIPESMQVQ